MTVCRYRAALPVPALFLLLGLCVCVEVRNLESDLYALTEAERAFSNLSRTTGMRDAFMTYLADDAVVLRPHPVPGRPIYAKSANHPNMLTWRPVFADVSYQGDLGYTTGPYEYRENGTDPPSGYGYYVSLWKKKENGTWRVIFDAGIRYSSPELSAGNLAFAEIRKQVSQNQTHHERAGELERFQNQENAFNRIFMDFGYLAAAETFYSPSLRFYRNGAVPIRGRENALNKLAAESFHAVSLPDTAILAASCDLGMTYGLFQAFEGDTVSNAWSQFSYLRIWKKEIPAGWRVVLDLALPVSTGLLPPPEFRENGIKPSTRIQ